ncbi:Metallothionein expression activator 1 [Pleurostoma richardsiae]|uniref:Metallothionein expression activator 1 n=1 Tax=Pleurostoma richardsiae TaxID=41990 RepID=A0AA38RUE9_9PEZI|nr:Metallothionein expression activator 1 [Pleurostoma richardsiae]
MLSNPTTTGGLHARQRQHRRQNSTPTAYEAVKIANLPNIQQRQHASHRRGLSLDTRRQQHHQQHTTMGRRSPTTTLRQEFTTHVLREAQQQRLARPGPGQAYANMAPHNDENYLLSPHGTPQSQRFDTAACYGGSPQQQDCMGIPFDVYGGQMNANMRRSPVSFANNMTGAQDFELFAPPDSAMSTPTFLNFQESPSPSQGWTSEGETTSTRRSSRRISNGIMDRVAKFENMGMEGPQRPITPPNQNVAGYFPPTPMETPHERMMKHEPRPSRFSDDYDESMEETIKPNRNRSNRSSGIFQEMRQQAEAVVMPTPPRTQTVSAGRLYDAEALRTADFMNMTNMNTEFMKIQGDFDGLPCHSSPLNVSPGMSHHTSPATPYMASFPSDPFENKPDFRRPDSDSQVTMTPGHVTHSRSQTGSPSHRGSSHRRTESLASVTSAASIASINIEETKTETGVSAEDVQAYIEGPDPNDGKWLCLFESCGKRFGRKENIKSHVQTHLNDRQYQCPNCHKCFVRQHDLKRHAKIHTGIKPYPCECGNSFARHDALTRHRQRGMCIGAFDGIVRKVVKRGRPRKHRPDMDERLDKAARTRTKNKAAGSPSSSSSRSGYSDSSAVNSPGDDLDNMLDDKPFAEMVDVTMAQDQDSCPMPTTTATMNPNALSSAPMPNLSIRGAPDLSTPSMASPEHQHNPTSPAHSHYSHVSHVSLANGEVVAVDGLPVEPGSPAKSVASHYTHQPGTPPELSASSSPPPMSSSGGPTRFFDSGVDPNSSGLSDLSLDLGEGSMMGGTSGGGRLSVSGPGDFANISGLSLGFEDDSLLQAFTNEDGLVSLDREFVMGGGKYGDDEYDPVNMFTTEDDVFFGSG